MSKTHTLISFIGKGMYDQKTGYRTATYRFPDKTERKTAFFGLALAEYLAPERLMLFGTDASQWDVLLENLAVAGEEEELRVELMDAVAGGRVDQPLLDRASPVIRQTLKRDISLCLIPYGRETNEQLDILDAVSRPPTLQG